MSSHTTPPEDADGRAPPAVTHSGTVEARSASVLLPPFAAGRTQSAPPSAPAPAPAPTRDEAAAPEADERPDVPSTQVADPWQSAVESGSVTPHARSEDAAKPTEPESWPAPADGEEGAAVPAWGAEEPAPPSEFPLDAFIIPEDSKRLPTGYEQEPLDPIANAVADRLDDLARQVRRRGLAAIGTSSTDELSRLIAAVVAGYVVRGE